MRNELSLSGFNRIGDLLTSERLGRRTELNRPVSGRIFTGARLECETRAIELKILTNAEDAVTAGSEIIAGLQRHGIEAKPFCFHKTKQNERSFSVQGENFKWLVVRISDFKNPEEIPAEMFRKLAVLKRCRIKHDSIHIAFPLESRAGKRIKGEMQALADSGRSLITGIGNAVCSIVMLPFAVVSTVLEEGIKDPVLLVRFENFFCELGRWE